MSMLGQNATPAERMRGCIFVETFANAAAVTKNGATVGGTPTFGPGYVSFDGASYLVYATANTTVKGSKACSLLIEATPASLAGTPFYAELGAAGGVANTGLGIYTDGTWKVLIPGVAVLDTGLVPVVGTKVQIAVTYGGGAGTVRCYANGVAGGTQVTTQAVTLSTLTIGCRTAGINIVTGQVHSVRLFDQELSPEEVVQYYTNQVYAYRSRPTIYLPMTNSCHTATQTLDVSGNQRNGVFPVNVPTKIVGRHGYTLNGLNNYFASALNGAFNTSEITFAEEFSPSFVQISANNKLFYDASNLARYFAAMLASGDLMIYLGNSIITTVLAATITPYWRTDGSLSTLVVSGKSGKTNVWFNGVRVAADVATVWAAANPANVWIGSNLLGSENWPGAITRFGSWPQALTSLQVYDLLAQWQRTASEV